MPDLSGRTTGDREGPAPANPCRGGPGARRATLVDPMIGKPAPGTLETVDAQLVDWDLAVATARRLVRPGPQLTRAEADDVVVELRRLAIDAEHHVQDYTHLRPAAAITPIAVVDRGEWARSNIAGLRMVTMPLIERLSDPDRGTLSTAVGR